MGLTISGRMLRGLAGVIALTLLPLTVAYGQQQTGAISLDQVPGVVKDAGAAAKSGVIFNSAVRYVKGDQYIYILYGVYFGSEVRVIVSADGVVRQVIEKERR